MLIDTLKTLMIMNINTTTKPLNQNKMEAIWFCVGVTLTVTGAVNFLRNSVQFLVTHDDQNNTIAVVLLTIGICLMKFFA